MNSAGRARKAVVLGGRTGLLGQSLTRVLHDAGWETLAVGRPELDVLNADKLAAFLDATEPDNLFNAVAYTQVDKAEDEPDQAFLLNKTLPALLGRLARDRHLPLTHFSTDFVFNGRAHDPYEPEDPPAPLSVYGSSKLAGELALRESDPPNLHIIRTAWLFGPGKKNFVSTILRLAAQREELTVVHDQVGSPTHTADLALHTLELVQRGAHGTFHVVNSGYASWCELAAEAVRLAGLPCRIRPIPSSQYPLKAVRPAYSVLSTRRLEECTGTTPRPWADALRDYVSRTFSSGCHENKELQP